MSKPQPLEVGTEAPNFKTETHDGETVELKKLRGKKVALYFYPKDDTPGCTKQACNLRDNLGTLEAKGVTVLGVSPDGVASHEKFAKKYELPFRLLPDPDKAIIEAYGVWGEKTLYGKKSMGLARTTFLIDEAGVIVHVFKRPKVAEHAEEILRKFGLE